MNEVTMFDETDGEQIVDPYAVFSTGELLSLGLIDEATMAELMAPWPTEMEMAA